MLSPQKPSTPPRRASKRSRRARLDPSLADPQHAERKAPGAPGFRTQPGHSSLDPIESYAESGYIAGVFLRDLLMLRLRPHSALGRLALLLAGALMLAPLALAIYQSSVTAAPDFGMVMVTSVPGVFGAYLWANLAASLRRRPSNTPPGKARR